MQNERQNLVAPCGIDCGMCELYACRDNQELLTYLKTAGIPEEKLPCDGCRDIKGDCPVIPVTCATYTCAEQKKVSFCFECQEFPCVKLHPSSDRANILPHNMKTYNLCTIKRDGLQKFIEQSPLHSKRYYKGKMSIGNGPVIDDQK
jgi:hypothetical protein